MKNIHAVYYMMFYIELLKEVNIHKVLFQCKICIDLTQNRG